ncbi:MAG: S8 family serine peptidase [Kiritimatiellae bacterium]|nr:S8 family serine peptidase [Kiritimatiellia bacterium]MCO5067811.1 S8 family serine peptidase [Kiritimatiellia bacterium]
MSRFWISLFLPLALALRVSAVQLSLEDDRMTLSVNKTPLREVLQSFAEHGVRIQVDPTLDVLVTGSCKSAPVEEALNALLQPFGYIVTWEVVPGPVADLPRLAEIQVFQRGAPKRIAPLPPETKLHLTRGPLPNSPLFVADEILLRVQPGTNADEFRTLLRQLGATVIGSIPELGIYQLRLPAGINVLDLVEQLKRNSLIKEVEPNYAELLQRTPMQQALDSPDANSADIPHVRSSAAPLAILDSGLLGGVGLDNAVVGEYNALFPDAGMGDPQGHGTQMALVAAGLIQPRGAAAVDEGVPLLAVRAFDENGATSNFALMRALQYAIDKGARVVNLSWGTETDSRFIADAVAYAQSRGVIVVAAAGNAPTGAAMYPAAYPGVVAVSALNADGTPWPQSNYGNFVSIAAPGTASFPIGHSGPPGNYAGTSIASAQVSRELALYLARNPKATATEAIRALQKAATDVGEAGRDSIYGYGALDAAAQAQLRK